MEGVVMRIFLGQDKTVNCDLNKIVKILNSICEQISFTTLTDEAGDTSSDKVIDFETERMMISQKLRKLKSEKGPDLFIYITTRPYRDNFYFHKKGNIMVLSLKHWEHYTDLPIENGIFYFIADILVLELDNTFRHKDITGCIYDFLGHKPGVDLGMKMAYICEECRERLSPIIKKDKGLAALYKDTTKILDVLNNTSRWGKSVFYVLEDKSFKYLDWSTFEDEIAEFYRKLGVEVKQDFNLGGFQIDIYLIEETPSHRKIKTAIECKFHRDKIGNRAVNDFIRMFDTLKQSGYVDRGVMVSYSGFTQDAQLVSRNNSSVELIDYKSLKEIVSEKTKTTIKELEENSNKLFSSDEYKYKALSEKKEKTANIFVIMPFSEDYDDIYYLGISETIKHLGYGCERVDEMEFVGGVLDKIYSSIKNSILIIAEVTTKNPNVMYELGYAHAIDKPVILLTKDITNSPFDIRGHNHIIYSSIVNLRELLTNRLKAILEFEK